MAFLSKQQVTLISCSLFFIPIYSMNLKSPKITSNNLSRTFISSSKLASLSFYKTPVWSPHKSNYSFGNGSTLARNYTAYGFNTRGLSSDCHTHTLLSDPEKALIKRAQELAPSIIQPLEYPALFKECKEVCQSSKARALLVEAACEHITQISPYIVCCLITKDNAEKFAHAAARTITQLDVSQLRVIAETSPQASKIIAYSTQNVLHLLNKHVLYMLASLGREGRQARLILAGFIAQDLSKGVSYDIRYIFGGNSDPELFDIVVPPVLGTIYKLSHGSILADLCAGGDSNHVESLLAYIDMYIDSIKPQILTDFITASRPLPVVPHEVLIQTLLSHNKLRNRILALIVERIETEKNFDWLVNQKFITSLAAYSLDNSRTIACAIAQSIPEKLLITQLTDGDSARMLGCFIVNNMDLYSDRVLQKLAATNSKCRDAIFIYRFQHKLGPLAQDYVISKLTTHNCAISVPVNVTQSEAHIRTVADRSPDSSLRHRIQTDLSFIKLIHQLHAHERTFIKNGMVVFIHAQAKQHGFLEDMYTDIVRLSINPLIARDYLFVRYLTQYGAQDAPDEETQRIKLMRGVDAGDRNGDFFFMNAFAAAGAFGDGACSLQYFIEDHSYFDPAVTLETIFTALGAPNTYKKYADLLEELRQKYHHVNPAGRLLQIAIPEKLVDSMVYLAAPGGPRISVANQHDIYRTPTELINAVKHDPEHFKGILHRYFVHKPNTFIREISLDEVEFCLVLTHKTLNPASGIKILAYELPAFAPQDWPEYTQYKAYKEQYTKTIAAIGQDVKAERTGALV